jgi:hypothetical protein
LGEAELNRKAGILTIHSVFFFYGDAASHELSSKMAEDIAMHWNEPSAIVFIKDQEYRVQFEISAYYEPDLDPEKVWYNDNPRFNFFRVEEFAEGDISYVDEIGCNTGYLKLANILQTSTTIAHEYGHTLGLVHHEVLDIRGMGMPGIMYPRGTICDPALQYDVTAQPAAYGGFLNPVHRKVLQSDIDALMLHKLGFQNGFAKLGEFSSIYHAKHIAADL